MTLQTSSAHVSAKIIHDRYPGFKPKVGIILGSGLGGFIEFLDNKQFISYQELPGFPEITVHGHGANLILGNIGDVSVLCMQGRAHSYEGSNYECVRTYVRTMKLLGCEYFIATNASGSLREEVGPGELVLIKDHINFQPGNPLVGYNDENFGPRFYPLDNAYDSTLRDLIMTNAQRNDIALHEGVYIGVLGPNYETAAEIRAFKIWGADVVGMSTVPEVLVANHCGLKVGVISIITNYATGLTTKSHDHQAVVAMAASAASKLGNLLKQTIQGLK